MTSRDGTLLDFLETLSDCSFLFITSYSRPSLKSIQCSKRKLWLLAFNACFHRYFLTFCRKMHKIFHKNSHNVSCNLRIKLFNPSLESYLVVLSKYSPLDFFYSPQSKQNTHVFKRIPYILIVSFPLDRIK